MLRLMVLPTLVRFASPSGYFPLVSRECLVSGQVFRNAHYTICKAANDKASDRIEICVLHYALNISVFSASKLLTTRQTCFASPGDAAYSLA
jgi:hypothetical protein